jgi:hypothetical protein
VPGLFSLSGVVTKPPGVALAEATIEIVDGPGTGLFVHSGLDGHFAFSALSGEVRVRAQKEGYDPMVRGMSMTTNQVADFELTPATTQEDVSGSYQLTLHAATYCKQSYFGVLPLPVDARSRTYSAFITQIDAQVSVELSGAEFVRDPPPSTTHANAVFSGRRLGQTITFQLGGNPEDGYPWIERITPTMYLGVGGTLVGTITGHDIEGDLDGILTTLDDRDSITGNCDSTGHYFVFERTPTIKAGARKRP